MTSPGTNSAPRLIRWNLRNKAVRSHLKRDLNGGEAAVHRVLSTSYLPRWRDRLRLKSMCRLLRCAYPDGVPDADCDALLHLLAQTRSRRQEAMAMAATFNMDYDFVCNDIRGAGSSPPEVIERVRRRLEQCGYSTWPAE